MSARLWWAEDSNISHEISENFWTAPSDYFEIAHKLVKKKDMLQFDCVMEQLWGIREGLA